MAYGNVETETYFSGIPTTSAAAVAATTTATTTTTKIVSFCLTRLLFRFCQVAKNKTSDNCSRCFYRLDALSVTQPTSTASEHYKGKSKH